MKDSMFVLGNNNVVTPSKHWQPTPLFFQQNTMRFQDSTHKEQQISPEGLGRVSASDQETSIVLLQKSHLPRFKPTPQ